MMQTPVASSQQTSLDNFSLKNNLSSLLVNYLALLCMFFQILPDSNPLLMIWLMVVNAVMLIRAVIELWRLWLVKYRSENRLLDSRIWLNFYNAGILLGGVLWAGMSLIVIPSGDLSDLFVLVVIISALSGGASGVLASSKYVGKLFITLLLLPASIALLFIENSVPLISLLGFMFWGVMLVTHHNNYRILFQSFRLRSANTELLMNLQSQNVFISTLNNDLEKRVIKRTAELETMAQKDTLTGLYNRAGFIAKALEIQKRDTSYSLYFFDLDRFKVINDTKGHDVGDLVLKYISKKLVENLPSHSVVGRWGGDEFVLCSSQVSNSEGIARLIQESIGAELKINNEVIKVSVSVGYALYPQDGNTLEDVINCADVATIWLKKNNRRGDVLAFNKDLARRGELKNALHEILINETFDEHFFLHYQPITLTDRSVFAVEALARLELLKLGSIPPDEFIPIIEKSGVMDRFGLWVMQTACEYIDQLHKQGIPIGLSINVSPIQLRDRFFVDKVISLFNTIDLDPRYVAIEVTENFLEYDDANALISRLKEFRHYGFSVHIDDFGTGYSSLARIRDLPATTLKIDRSFVQSMAVDGDGLIKGVLYIAEQFGLKVIVEGVETQAQFEYLTDLGCKQFQGYYLAKPTADLKSLFDINSEVLTGINLQYDFSQDV